MYMSFEQHPENTAFGTKPLYQIIPAISLVIGGWGINLDNLDKLDKSGKKYL